MKPYRFEWGVAYAATPGSSVSTSHSRVPHRVHSGDVVFIEGAAEREAISA